MTASLARKSATVAEYSFPSETKVIIWQNNHNYLRYVSMVTFCTVSPVTIIHAIRYTWAHPHPLIGSPMILPNFTEGPTHQKLSNVFRVSSLVNDRATCKKAYIPVTDILSLFFLTYSSWQFAQLALTSETLMSKYPSKVWAFSFL